MSKSTPQPAIDIDDIHNPKFAASTLDFLLIELVPLVQRVTEQAQAREQLLRDEYRRSKILSRTSDDTTTAGDQHGATEATTEDNKAGDTKKDGALAAADTRPLTSLGIPATTSATQDAMHARLDALGYRVGQGLAERYIPPLFHEPRPSPVVDHVR